MKGLHAFGSFLLALGVPILAGGHLTATEPTALPKPAEVQSLAVHPTQVTLKGMDDAQQMVLTATLAGGKLQDLSGDVKYEVADQKVARVNASGRVLPVGNGTTELKVSYGDKVVKVPLTAESCDAS